MPMMVIKGKAGQQQKLIDAVAEKASDLLSRAESSDLVLVVYEKEGANIYYEGSLSRSKGPKA